MLMKKFLFSFYLLSISSFAAEQPGQGLPQPLTLEAALKLIDKNHPDLLYADSLVKTAESNLDSTRSNSDFSASLRAEARYIEPSSTLGNTQNDDHRLGLYVNKLLYDFGRQDGLVASAGLDVTSKNFLYRDAYQNQHLAVMQAYFNVVLADLQFYRYNEEMAIAFIQYDRIQNRQRLGQHTDLEVAEKEVEYQRIRRLRAHSQNQQRVTRAILAQALNRPDDLPETVARPKLDSLTRKLPEVEELQKQMLDNNPVLKALRANIDATRQNLESARSGKSPIISAGVEAHAYSREIGSSDKLRAMITVDIPLWSGDRVDAAVAKAMSEVHRAESVLLQHQRKLQQQVLEIWLDLQTLKLKFEEAEAGMNYSELYLDNSRALYELEVSSDLGYSMVRYTDAERNVLETSFEIAMKWAQLDALTGRLGQQDK